LRRHGQRVLPVASDVTTNRAFATSCSRALDRFGQIDILVNNAGVGETQSVVDMDPAYWDRIMHINVRGPMLVLQARRAALIGRQSGR